MIEYLGEWIKHIVLLILVATFFDLLLPNSSMRRYVRMVIGLLIMLLILSPLLDLLQFDYDRMLKSVDELLEEESEDWSDEIGAHLEQVQMLQNETIREEVEYAMADELRTDVMARFDVNVLDADIRLHVREEEAEVEEVMLHLQWPEQSVSSKADSGTSKVTVAKDGSDASDGLDGKEDGEVMSSANRESAAEKKEPRTDTEEADDEQSADQIAEIEPVHIEPIEVSPRDSEDEMQEESQRNGLSKEESNLEDDLVTYLMDNWHISEDKISFSWTRGENP
jgi:stage III sporulation protein AF